ncbi:hypothetical protein, partial [Salmonella enterica]|uniref:hypothetical protein n=1 Tax=Salmonella enterica TaxID=28901 RepID=UPI00195813C8
RSKDKNNQSNKQCRETTYGWFFCAFNLYADRERELSSAIHSKNIGSGISASTTVMCYRPARTYGW